MVEAVIANEIPVEEITLAHDEIEIGKTVTWIEEVSLTNDTDILVVELPEDATLLNVEIIDEDTGESSQILDVLEVDETPLTSQATASASLEIIPEVLQEELPTKLVTIEETGQDYTLEFETPAPYTIENENSTEHEYEKEVTVAHDSTLHYTDVKSYTDIPEELVEEGIEFSLYWMIDGEKKDVTDHPLFKVEFVDTDGNGIVDQMQWVVPQLSEQTFIIEAVIDVGDKPYGIAVNQITNRIYVVNEGTDNVSVIDGETDSVIATIDVGDNPEGVAVNPITNLIYVTNENDDSISVIDGTTNAVIDTIESTQQHPIDDPEGITVNVLTNRIYVANDNDDTVSVIDGDSQSSTYHKVIATISVGNKPEVLDVNHVTNTVYVANELSNSVSVIDGEDNEVIALITNQIDDPEGIAVNENTQLVYVVSVSINYRY